MVFAAYCCDVSWQGRDIDNSTDSAGNNSLNSIFGMKQKLHQNSVSKAFILISLFCWGLFGVFLAAGTAFKEVSLSALNENSHVISVVDMTVCTD